MIVLRMKQNSLFFIVIVVQISCFTSQSSKRKMFVLLFIKAAYRKSKNITIYIDLLSYKLIVYLCMCTVAIYKLNKTFFLFSRRIVFVK
jgi:hypothetical protein